MEDINKLYKKWTDGEDDNPFSKESEWRGDMVKGFVNFCLKENLTKHNIRKPQSACPQCHRISYNPQCQYCNENRYLPDEEAN